MCRTYWKYCDLCSKPVKYVADPLEMRDNISKELAIRMEEHQLNLCRSCNKDFASCNGNPEFGACVGLDNVINCSAYDETEEPRW